MAAVTKWAFRIGLFSLLGAFIGSMCLAALDLLAPSGTAGNREPAEFVVGILLVIFIGLGFVVFVGALRKLHDVREGLSPTMKAVLIWALVATNFFGGYIFFVVYPWLLGREVE